MFMTTTPKKQWMIDTSKLEWWDYSSPIFYGLEDVASWIEWKVFEDNMDFSCCPVYVYGAEFLTQEEEKSLRNLRKERKDKLKEYKEKETRLLELLQTEDSKARCKEIKMELDQLYDEIIPEEEK